jgi:hypothetical protein
MLYTFQWTDNPTSHANLTLMTSNVLEYNEMKKFDPQDSHIWIQWWAKRIS